MADDTTRLAESIRSNTIFSLSDTLLDAARDKTAELCQRIGAPRDDQWRTDYGTPGSATHWALRSIVATLGRMELGNIAQMWMQPSDGDIEFESWIRSGALGIAIAASLVVCNSHTDSRFLVQSMLPQHACNRLALFLSRIAVNSPHGSPRVIWQQCRRPYNDSVLPPGYSPSFVMRPVRDSDNLVLAAASAPNDYRCLVITETPLYTDAMLLRALKSFCAILGEGPEADPDIALVFVGDFVQLHSYVFAQIQRTVVSACQGRHAVTFHDTVEPDPLPLLPVALKDIRRDGLRSICLFGPQLGRAVATDMLVNHGSTEFWTVGTGIVCACSFFADFEIFSMFYAAGEINAGLVRNPYDRVGDPIGWLGGAGYLPAQMHLFPSATVTWPAWDIVPSRVRFDRQTPMFADVVLRHHEPLATYEERLGAVPGILCTLLCSFPNIRRVVLHVEATDDYQWIPPCTDSAEKSKTVIRAQAAEAVRALWCGVKAAPVDADEQLCLDASSSAVTDEDFPPSRNL